MCAPGGDPLAAIEAWPWWRRKLPGRSPLMVRLPLIDTGRLRCGTWHTHAVGELVQRSPRHAAGRPALRMMCRAVSCACQFDTFLQCTNLQLRVRAGGATFRQLTSRGRVMAIGKRQAVRVAAIAVSAIAAFGTSFATPHAYAADGNPGPTPGEAKASNDAAGAWDLVGNDPGHSAAWSRREVSKDQAARDWERGAPGGAAELSAAFNAEAKRPATTRRSHPDTVTPDMCPPDQPGCNTGGTPPASASLTGNQAAQINSYYCGPAAVHEALGSVGIGSTQSGLGSALKTNSNGTAWYGVYVSSSPSTGWPVEDVLNNRVGSSFYNSISVDYTPTDAQKSSFQSRLKADVYSGWPLVGNAYEVAGGPHLVGHPVDRTIYHYFAVRGYSSSGASTMYEDSVHNASSISWSSGVPAYSTLSSNTIVTIVGGRGYVW